MGIGDYVDKAKDALKGNEEKVAGALDKVADAVKSRTSDENDKRVDSAVEKAKDFLSKQDDEHEVHPPVRHTERPNPPAL